MAKTRKTKRTSRTAMRLPTIATPRVEQSRFGRKRDPSLDTAILRAALEVLAASGYEGMTMDRVAAHAKVGKAALYRRWPSKEALVLEAVTQMKQAQAGLDHLPDTGTLRGDLLALVKPQSAGERDFKLKVMSGLSAMIAQHHSLADAGIAAIIEPWASAYRQLIRRAAERGEVNAASDVDAIAHVVPSMMAFRTIVLKKPFSKPFLVSLVDGVVLPALGISHTIINSGGSK